jgi:hypothetical protein
LLQHALPLPGKDYTPQKKRKQIRFDNAASVLRFNKPVASIWFILRTYVTRSFTFFLPGKRLE